MLKRKTKIKWEEYVRKYVTQKDGRTREKLRTSADMMERDK
jgi:hypothetical protein